MELSAASLPGSPRLPIPHRWCPGTPLHHAYKQGSPQTIQAPSPGNTLTGPHIQEFGCQKSAPEDSGKGTNPLPAAPAPFTNSPTSLSPFSVRHPTGPGRQRATASSPPPHSTLLGIQPPSPGASGPQLSQAALLPMPLPCLLGIPSCPHLKLPAASELPSPPLHNSP